MSICSIEDVASVTSKPFWFQLYVMKDRDFVQNLIDRAKKAKCSALVVTADLQILGQRHKDLHNGLSAPPKFTPKHVWQMATRPQWCLGMLGTKRHSFGNIVATPRCFRSFVSQLVDGRTVRSAALMERH